MATTSDYLTQLQADKQALVDNLVAKGVSATNDETFTSLVPKVNDIQTGGGGDLSEYFSETISEGTATTSGLTKTILQMPKFTNAGTSCVYMFSGFYGTEIDLSNFNTTETTSFGYMFNQCTNLINIINIENLNTEKITSMTRMFYYCYALANLNLSKWNTSQVQDFSYMFQNCSTLKDLDLKNFDGSSASTIGSMFYYCSALETIDLSNFNPVNATSINYMFGYCNQLKRLDIRSFDFTNITSYNNAFRGVPTDCLIIVKDETAKEWITSKFTTLTNVKTVAELE